MDSLNDLSQIALALLAVMGVIASVIGTPALASFLRARAAEIDNKLLRLTVEGLIDYLEAKAQGVPGKKRMELLLEEADKRGLDVDEHMAEAVFQQWQRQRKAEKTAEASAIASTQPVVLPHVWVQPPQQDQGTTQTFTLAATEVPADA